MASKATLSFPDICPLTRATLLPRSKEEAKMANSDYDAELFDMLQEAINSGELDEEADRNAIGVARQVLDMGYDSLSPKQKGLYDAKIVPAIKSVTKEWKMNELAFRFGD